MTEGQQQKALRTGVSLTFAMVAGWVICFWPARILNGVEGVWWMSLAAVCCLVPGWIVIFISSLSVFSNDLSIMLVQMTVRLLVVGGAAIAVKRQHPELGPGDFTGWLVVFYMLALFVEVYLLRNRSSKLD